MYAGAAVLATLDQRDALGDAPHRHRRVRRIRERRISAYLTDDLGEPRRIGRCMGSTVRLRTSSDLIVLMNVIISMHMQIDNRYLV